jgi:RHS repeat-associated protein
LVGRVGVIGSVDESGHSVAEVPLDVLPIGSKFIPALSLTYNSGYGSLSDSVKNWNLSGLMSIIRCPKNPTDDGSYSSVNFSTDDRFCLNGKRLVLVAGSYGLDGSEYRTVPDEFHKITFRKNSQSDPGIFEVRLKSGEIAVLGDKDESRELDSSSGRGTFSWSISKKQDRVGNEIVYSYRKSTPFSRPQLASLLYGGNTVTGVPHSRRISLNYRLKESATKWRANSSSAGEAILERVELYNRDRLVHYYKVSWQPRPFSTFEDIVAVEKCFPSGACLNPTRFEYTGVSSSFTAMPIQNREVSFDASTDFEASRSYRYFEDVNGDGFKDFLTISRNGVFQANGSQNGFGTASAVQADISFLQAMNKSSRGDPMYLVDYDLDGYQDLLFLAVTITPDKQGFYLAKGHGSGFGSFASIGTPSVVWNASRHIPTVADVNGDGRLDVTIFHEDGAIWYKNSGTGLLYQGLAVADFGMKNGWSNTLHQRIVSDLNSDGYPDLIGFHDNEVRVALGNGSGFGSPRAWIADFGAKQGYTIDTPRIVIDINGDYLPDIVCFSKEGVRVAINTGTSFQPAIPWMQELGFDQGWTGASKGQRFLADINADGLFDFIGLSNTNLTVVINRGGMPFESKEQSGQFKSESTLNQLGTWSPSTSFAIPADMNGDGSDDLSVMLKGGLQTFKNSSSDILLKKVIDGFGNSTSFEYLPQNDLNVYKSSSEAAVYPRLKLIGSRLLVRRIVSSSPEASDHAIRYSFEDSIVQLAGKGFLGFRRSTSEDELTNIVIETTKSDGSDGNPEGAILEETSYLKRPADGTKRKISSTKNSWKKVAGSGTNATFSYPYYVEQLTWDPQNGALLSKTVRDDSFNSMGSLKESIASISDAYGMRMTWTVNNYDDNLESWQLGRLNKSTVKTWQGMANDTPWTGDVGEKVSSFDYDAQGLLHSTTTEPGTRYAQTEVYGRTRNKFGLIDTVTKTWQTPDYPTWAAAATKSTPSNTVIIISKTFDADGFLKDEINSLGHLTTTQINPNTGSIESFTDVNGISESVFYNEQGLAYKKINGDRNEIYIDTLPCDASCPKTAIYFTKTSGAGHGTVISYFNSRSLEIRRETQGFQGKWTIVDTEHDALSRIIKKSRPYFKEDKDIFWTHFEYDELQRPLKTVTADAAIYERVYDGLTLTEIDPDRNKTIKKSDSEGRIRAVTDHDTNTVTYEYDVNGRLSAIVDPKLNRIEYTYDPLGRKTTESDQDRGLLEIVYNGINKPAATRDAAGVVTVNEYDDLGRLTARKFSTGRVETLAYDSALYGVGLLASDSTAGVTRSYRYNEKSKIDRAETTIDPAAIGFSGVAKQTFAIDYAYDSMGRPSKRTYPGGNAVETVYDEYGTVTGSKNAVTQKALRTVIELTPEGSIKKEKYANGLTTDISKAPLSGRITGISVSKDGVAGLVFAETYDFSLGGNLKTKSDTLSGHQETYGYDHLNRLRTVHAGDGTLLDSIDFDYAGNVTQKSGVGSYKYGNSICGVKNPLNAPVSVGGKDLCYDAKGQLTHDGSRTFEYNEVGQPRSVKRNKGTSQYLYDAIGNLVLTVNTDSSGTSQLEFAPTNDYGLVVQDQTRIASIKVDESVLWRVSGGGLPQERFIHHDRMGSIVAISDAVGNLVERASYSAFGSPAVAKEDGLKKLDTFSSDLGFTEHKTLPSGLIHMRGRLYDPIRGQFLTPDLFIQDIHNLQSLNRYAYVLGNPFRSRDPSGFFSMGDITREIGKGIDGIVRAGQRLGDWLSKDQNQRLICQLAITAATGYLCAPYSLYSWQLYAYSAAGGALSAAVGSKGNPQAITRGALTAVAFAAVGSYFKSAAGFKAFVAPVTNGLVAGLSTQTSGGSFRSGFMSGFASAALGQSGVYATLKMDTAPDDFWNFAYNTAVAGAIGGAVSENAGSTFENGAVTAAFQRLFADIMTATYPAQPTRSLTSNEIALAKKAYAALHGSADGVDFSKIQIIKGKFLAFQPDNVAITPDGNIYFPGDPGDFAINPSNRYLFVHEMEHVWQFQHGIDVLMKAAPLQVVYWMSAKLIDIYLVPQNKSYEQMTVEQQANLLWDRYLNSNR